MLPPKLGDLLQESLCAGAGHAAGGHPPSLPPPMDASPGNDHVLSLRLPGLL